MHRGAFPAAGYAGTQGDDAAEELDGGVAQRHVALMPGQAFHDVGDADAAIGRGEAREGEADQQGGGDGGDCAAGDVQFLEGFGVAAEHGQGAALDGDTEGDADDAGEGAGDDGEERELRQGIGAGEASAEGFEGLEAGEPAGLGAGEEVWLPAACLPASAGEGSFQTAWGWLVGFGLLVGRHMEDTTCVGPGFDFGGCWFVGACWLYEPLTASEIALLSGEWLERKIWCRSGDRAPTR